ncbi:hypothetical protein SCOCK_450028 [Actinacidiphila cocklensis]|uniref:Uncharacterized protein n=1 Tax=Actinacidiphila cocklensis TaxID=887465 RepID=A0A9W4GTX0_9ACTN|nr:hypothetical protein SCOCK_450028 [Actinacidiphila cocklensis]
MSGTAAIHGARPPPPARGEPVTGAYEAEAALDHPRLRGENPFTTCGFREGLQSLDSVAVGP